MAAYGQRVDLNNPMNRQQYGDKKKLADAQRAVPVASSPNVSAPVARPVPGERGSLTRPTERPNEEITTGAPFGSGAGPQAQSPLVGPPQGSQPDLIERVRAIASQYPNPNIMGLLRVLEAG